MKIRSSEKPGILSSVIVSLLAGFIYYQFGNDLQVTLEKSYKAVLSYSDSEIFGPFNSLSLSSADEISDNKSGKNKKSGFYFKKRNTEILLDDEYSVLLNKNQAKLQRSLPDKNIDFTSELNNLIKNYHQPEIPDLKRNQKTKREVAENGVNFNIEYPLNKIEKVYSDDNSVSGFEINVFPDEGILKFNEINALKAELKFIGNEIKNNIDLKCRYEQDKKNMKELNSIEIHLEIHIVGSDKNENSPVTEKEN